MLKSIRLQHFRSFEESAEAIVAPITLIYGANSAGKSSIIKSLLLLKQSLGDRGEAASSLRFDGPIVDLGSARAVAHGHSFESPIRISIVFEISKTDQSRLSGSITFEVSSDEAKEDRLEIALQILGNSFVFRFEEKFIPNRCFVLEPMSRSIFDEAMNVLATQNSRLELFPDLSTPSDPPVFAVSDLLPSVIVGRVSRRQTVKTEKIILSPSEQYWNDFLASELRTVFIEAVDRVSYLGPLRKSPNRFELLDRSSGLKGVGKQGEYAFSVLKRDDTLLERVNKSLRNHLESPYALELPTWPEENDGVVRDLLPVSIVPVLRHVESGVAISIADAGFGLSQLLPFLIEMEARQNTLICIEQPELHLHPRLQSRMAETLLMSERGGNRNRFLIETHSEHLLLRIQRMIRDGRLSSSDVSILYVDNQDPIFSESGEIIEQVSSLKSRIVQIRLDKYGDMIDPWPGGFFDERFEELGFGR